MKKMMKRQALVVKVIYALVALLAVAGIMTTAYFAMNRNQAGKTVTSSSSQASKRLVQEVQVLKTVL